MQLAMGSLPRQAQTDDGSAEPRRRRRVRLGTIKHKRGLRPIFDVKITFTTPSNYVKDTVTVEFDFNRAGTGVSQRGGETVLRYRTTEKDFDASSGYESIDMYLVTEDSTAEGYTIYWKAIYYTYG